MASLLLFGLMAICELLRFLFTGVVGFTSAAYRTVLGGGMCLLVIAVDPRRVLAIWLETEAPAEEFLE